MGKFISFNNSLACIAVISFPFPGGEIKQASQQHSLFYYMAVSHEDWELLNSKIWWAQTDFDRSLNFPIQTSYILSKLKYKNIDYFSIIYRDAKKPQKERKRQEDEQSLADLCSAHCHLQAKCQLVQISYITWIKFFLFATFPPELNWSVWENLGLGLVYRPHCI